MRAADALRLAIPRLRAAGVADAPGDGRRLLAHAMGLAPDRLTLHLPDEVTAAQCGAFEAALLARIARQPVSQIIGSRAFHGLNFRVTRDVLDPRPETELLVEAALARPFVNMLDLGTGTGCVKFRTAGSGRGLCVKNNAASVWNRPGRPSIAAARRHASASAISDAFHMRTS